MPREKAPLKADKASITSARERDLAQSQREGKRERVRPSIARPAAAGRERERDGESERPAGRAKARDERKGAMLPPPNPVRRTSSSARTAAPSTRDDDAPVVAPVPQPQRKAASTVQDILALADSPPSASEPLVSSRVLSSSRAVNGAPPSTSTAGASATGNEDRVRAKRAALLAAARSSRAA